MLFVEKSKHFVRKKLFFFSVDDFFVLREGYIFLPILAWKLFLRCLDFNGLITEQ